MQVYFKRVRALFSVFLKRFARSSLVIMIKNESLMDGVASADGVPSADGMPSKISDGVPSTDGMPSEDGMPSAT